MKEVGQSAGAQISVAAHAAGEQISHATQATKEWFQSKPAETNPQSELYKTDPLSTSSTSFASTSTYPSSSQTVVGSGDSQLNPQPSTAAVLVEVGFERGYFFSCCWSFGVVIPHSPPFLTWFFFSHLTPPPLKNTESEGGWSVCWRADLTCSPCCQRANLARCPSHQGVVPGQDCRDRRAARAVQERQAQRNHQQLLLNQHLPVIVAVDNIDIDIAAVCELWRLFLLQRLPAHLGPGAVAHGEPAPGLQLGPLPAQQPDHLGARRWQPQRHHSDLSSSVNGGVIKCI